VPPLYFKGLLFLLIIELNADTLGCYLFAGLRIAFIFYPCVGTVLVFFPVMAAAALNPDRVRYVEAQTTATQEVRKSLHPVAEGASSNTVGSTPAASELVEFLPELMFIVVLIAGLLIMSRSLPNRSL
jgi:hypothetical protein